MRFGLAMSSSWQTGQSDEIHSPVECASTVLSLISPAVWSTRVDCRVAISCWPNVLRIMLSPSDKGAWRKICSAAPLPSGRMVATIDFSGLMSSTCARARAAAKLPMEPLDCCMSILGMQELKGDGTGFGALGAHAMADRLLRVLRHEALQFSFGAFVFEKCRVCSRKRAGEFCPAIGRAHIDDADRLNARLRWLDAEEGRGLAALHTPPELPL